MRFAIIITLLVFFGFVFVKSAEAISCQPALSGDHTINADCSFGGNTDGNNPTRLVDGTDAGTGSSNTSTISVDAGILTINANQTIASGSFILAGGSIALADGALMNPGTPLWVVDQDGDGYGADIKVYSQITQPNNGVRRNTMRNLSESDCDDTSYSETNVCCVAEALYQDTDGDGYGDPNNSVVECAPLAGYVTNNTDCYDSNANAYPGSIYCSSSNRGDGSFDYNCTETETKCQTTYTHRTTTSNYTRNVGLGSCNQNNCRCVSKTSAYYATSSFSCGQTGALCTGNSGFEYGCNEASCGLNCVPAGISTRCTSISTGVQKCQ